MKKNAIISGILVGLIFSFKPMAVAQVCGSVDWLNTRVIPTLSIQLLNTSGQEVTSISPSTNYILRVITPTGQGVISGVCVVTGSGCAGGSAPGAFSITFASGCTVDGKSIPPETASRDVGPSNNYTANFNLRTLPSGSFTGQVLVLIQAFRLRSRSLWN